MESPCDHAPRGLDEARENGLWDVLYEYVTAGMTKEDLLGLYEWVKLDSLDDGEGWSE